jgi:hypothetical protein
MNGAYLGGFFLGEAYLGGVPGTVAPAAATVETLAAPVAVSEEDMATDNNTLEAVQRLYATADPAVLPQLLTERPKAGRLQSPQTDTYAVLACKLVRRDSAGTGGVWHDHRLVTITVYGVKAKVNSVMDAMLEVFNVGCQLDYIGPAPTKPDKNGLPLFVRWWPAPDNGDMLEEDETTKAGQDVWKGKISAEVWSIRTR